MGKHPSDPAITISDNAVLDAVLQADVAIAPNGNVYVVWADYSAGIGDIFLCVYDPDTGLLSEITQITTG